MPNENRDYLIELSGNLAKARAAGKKLSVEQLDRLIDGLTSAKEIVAEQEAKEAEEIAKKQSAASEIAKLMAESGITLDDLDGLSSVSTKKALGKVPSKYRIEVEGQTHEWTGRGIMPKVFKEYLSKHGLEKEDVLIK